MKLVDQTSFAGEAPRVDPQDLDPAQATVALNVNLVSGNIEPLRAPALAASLAKAGVKRAIYRFGKDALTDGQHWFSWTTDVDVALGAVADDTQERTYYTGDSEPRWTDSTLATQTASMPSGYWRLGLPAPTKPGASVSGTPETGATAQSLLVAYAFVSVAGEEGPCSPVSIEVDWMPGQTLTVSGLDAAPSGPYNVALRRIYVSLTDSTGASALRFWRDAPLGAASVTAALDATLLADAAPSPSPLPPPADGFGIMAHPRGFHIMFSGKSVLRSEIFKPYAWPAEYRDPVAYDIVGGAVVGDAAVICTRGATYFASGTDPLNFTPTKLEGTFPCVAKRSIRETSAGVIFASTGGLVLVTPAGTQRSLTKGLFTRKQWQALKPESMHAAVHDDRYIFWFDTGSSRGGYVLQQDDSGIVLSRTDIYATAAYADPRQDKLFVALDDGHVHQWDAGALLSATWRSKDYLLPRPFALGAVMVEADAYPVTLKVYADGALHTTVAVTSRRPQRFAPRRARKVAFAFEGTPTVRAYSVGSAIDDLVA